MKQPLSKEELIQRLKVLSEIDPKSLPPEMTAMCYCPSAPPYDPPSIKIKLTCQHCKKKYPFDCNHLYRFLFGKPLFKRISLIVKQINELGYDCHTEMWCKECIGNAGIKDKFGEYPLSGGNLLLVFFFKTEGQEEYHKAISDNDYDYRVVLAFLKNEPTFKDDYRCIQHTINHIDTIQYMTGIKTDE